MFPYDFCLVMEYQLTDEGILINYRVENHGEKTMYYCQGAHPAFNCPMEDGEHFEDYCLEFEHKENCCAMVYDLKRLEFDAESKGYHMADTAVLPLKYELFDSDAIYFENLKSQKVSLVHGRTKRRRFCASNPGTVPLSGRMRMMSLCTSTMCRSLMPGRERSTGWKFGFWREKHNWLK